MPSIPFAYSEGSVEFFYRRFQIDPRALIPRFETESLAREAIRMAREESYWTLVDVWTGSGVLAVSVGLSVPFKRVIALDISTEALSLARENAKWNGLIAEFYQSDLLSAFQEPLLSKSLWIAPTILFVANLPYIRNGDPQVSSDIVHEPEIALYGWEVTGFEITLRFLKEFEVLCARFSKGRFRVMCEVGHHHRDEIMEAGRALGREIRIFQDLRNIPRFFTYRTW